MNNKKEIINKGIEEYIKRQSDHIWRVKMQVAKLFTNGRKSGHQASQGGSILRNRRIHKKIGNMVIMFPKDDPWAPLINGLNQFTNDFMETR